MWHASLDECRFPRMTPRETWSDVPTFIASAPPRGPNVRHVTPDQTKPDKRDRRSTGSLRLAMQKNPERFPRARYREPGERTWIVFFARRPPTGDHDHRDSS